VERDFALLDELSAILVEETRKLDRRAGDELRRRRHLQQAILQHYQVCETPFLDLSQSLGAACSFAQISAGQMAAASRSGDPGMAGSAPGERVYLYVLALPFPTGGISIDSREEIVSVRLLSVCPSLARRPYFQDALLAGTVDISDNYEEKNELDFNRRLVAKFSIPSGDEFWANGPGRIDSALLFPGKDDDPMLQVCSALQSAVTDMEGLLFAPVQAGAPQGAEDSSEKATINPSGEAVLGIQDIAYRLRRRLG